MSGGAVEQRTRHPQKAPAVFLCHTGQDKLSLAFVEMLHEKLRKKFCLGTFLDSASLGPGVEWEREIEYNVRNCRVFVCILSKPFFGRYWCMHELDIALMSDRTIIPVCHGCSAPHVDDKVKGKLSNCLKKKVKEGIVDPADTDATLERWCQNLRRLKGIQGVYNKSSVKTNQIPFRDDVVAAIVEALRGNDECCLASSARPGKRLFVILALVAVAVVAGAVIGSSIKKKRTSNPSRASSPTKQPTAQPTAPPTPGPTKHPTWPPTLQPVAPTATPTTPTTWKRLGPALDGEGPGDRFGWSVALSVDGSIVAVGAPYNRGTGHVRVYQYNSTDNQWNQLGYDLDGEAAGDEFGHSVALSADGSIVAVGGIRNDESYSEAGHVRVYQYNDTNNQWNRLGPDLYGANSRDFFGSSVALSADGSILAASGLRTENGLSRGHVRVFQYNSTSNNQWNRLGPDLEFFFDGWFGFSVALSEDGSIVAVGVPENYGNGNTVRVYQFNSTNTQWNKLGSDLEGESARESFRLSLALSADGSIVAVGSGPENDEIGYNAGCVRVFQYNSTQWEHLGPDLDEEACGNEFGNSVALSADGSILAVGAPYHDGTHGHVRVFQYDSTNTQWNKVGSDLNGETGGDAFGYSVALSANGSVVAVGAIYNDGNGTTFSGHVRVFQSQAGGT